MYEQIKLHPEFAGLPDQIASDELEEIYSWSEYHDGVNELGKLAKIIPRQIQINQVKYHDMDLFNFADKGSELMSQDELLDYQFGLDDGYDITLSILTAVNMLRQGTNRFSDLYGWSLLTPGLLPLLSDDEVEDMKTFFDRENDIKNAEDLPLIKSLSASQKDVRQYLQQSPVLVGALRQKDELYKEFFVQELKFQDLSQDKINERMKASSDGYKHGIESVLKIYLHSFRLQSFDLSG